MELVEIGYHCYYSINHQRKRRRRNKDSDQEDEVGQASEVDRDRKIFLCRLAAYAGIEFDNMTDLRSGFSLLLVSLQQNTELLEM
jgi:hypothetical protein